jgi:ribonuclease Z
MDHIMGIPTLVRHHHASPRPLDIFGPPGIAERVYHLLMGYEWNLSEPNWFTIRVHEIRRERVRRYSFIGPEGFVSRFDGEETRNSREIWSCRYVSVTAELLDHKLPVLAYRVQEKPHFAIDPVLMQQNGIIPGDWIRDLKSSVWKGRIKTGISVLRSAGGIEREEKLDDPDSFYSSIQATYPCASIGYLCDVGWTRDNIDKIVSFLSGTTLLCADCTFLAADVEKARNSYHFCTEDLNELAIRLSPRFLLPIHLSKSYIYRTVDLYKELHPPEGTTILPLPKHIVPAPLMVQDVDRWLRPPCKE